MNNGHFPFRCKSWREVYIHAPCGARSKCFQRYTQNGVRSAYLSIELIAAEI
jgi:hypothetical protein